MDQIGDHQDMWDDADGFYYDVLRLPDGSAQRLAVRSMVGLRRMLSVLDEAKIRRVLARMLDPALLQLYSFYGDEFTVECPTGSGRQMTLFEVARDISERLERIFLRDENGRRPVYGATRKFQEERGAGLDRLARIHQAGGAAAATGA